MRKTLSTTEDQTAAFAARLMAGFGLFSLQIGTAMFSLMQPPASPQLRPAPLRRPARRR